jgi:hypothetical protein
MGRYHTSRFTSETGCEVTVWKQHPAVGERPEGVYLRLTVDDRSAELHLTPVEAVELATALLGAAR